MIRKDLIEAETQKTAEALAAIIGLKNEGRLDEAWELSFESLSAIFHLERITLEQSSVEDFQAEIRTRNMSADNLNALGQLLFESAHPFQDTDECHAIIHKTAFIFTMLETEYHQQSLENLSRREMIDHFLSNKQYE